MITGLSGSGKTSLAQELIKQMKSKSWTAVHLDGDCLRKYLEHTQIIIKGTVGMKDSNFF